MARPSIVGKMACNKKECWECTKGNPKKIDYSNWLTRKDGRGTIAEPWTCPEDMLKLPAIIEHNKRCDRINKKKNNVEKD